MGVGALNGSAVCGARSHGFRNMRLHGRNLAAVHARKPDDSFVGKPINSRTGQVIFRGRRQPRVVPGSQCLRTQVHGSIKQRTEFYGSIAEGTGIGRAPRRIRCGKGNQNLTFENWPEISHMQGHAKGSAGRCKAGGWLRGDIG